MQAKYTGYAQSVTSGNIVDTGVILYDGKTVFLI